jgi:hypothetical protein
MGTASGSTTPAGGGSVTSNPWDQARQYYQDYLRNIPYNVGILKKITFEPEHLSALQKVYDYHNNQGTIVDYLRFYPGYDTTRRTYLLSVLAVTGGADNFDYIEYVRIGNKVANPSDKPSGPCPPICDLPSPMD